MFHAIAPVPFASSPRRIGGACAVDRGGQSAGMKANPSPMATARGGAQRRLVKICLLVLAVMAVVCLPFALVGEAYALPWLATREHQQVWLTGTAIVLLAADAVAPVPSVLVILFLAAKAGWVAGVIGGTLGLTAGVGLAWWFGRVAVGRLVPRFFPDEEMAALRAGLLRRLPLTLACWRSVPVMAETSVILAAAAGVPLRPVLRATVLPNFLIALIYSLATENSLAAAGLAFAGTVAVSLLTWRWVRPSDVAEGRTPA